MKLGEHLRELGIKKIFSSDLDWAVQTTRIVKGKQAPAFFQIIQNAGSISWSVGTIWILPLLMGNRLIVLERDLWVFLGKYSK